MAQLFGNGKPQPRKCPGCAKRLPNAIFEVPHFEGRYPTGHPKAGYLKWVPGDNVWRIRCSCGTILTWAYPSQWDVSHELPLWEAVL